MSRRSPGSRSAERRQDHEKGLVYYIMTIQASGDRMILAEVHTLAEARRILPNFDGLETITFIENSTGVRY